MESSFSRRKFLGTLAGAALGFSIPRKLRAEAAGQSTVSIFHTTDLHGNILPTSNYDGVGDLGGFARCATQIRNWRMENPNSLTIDVGDLYQGTEAGLRTRGQIMVNALNSLNYDAWVFGNHEFDWGMAPFVSALKHSAMPVLGANATLGGQAAGQYADASHPFARMAPFLLKEVGGFKIAIIGVTTPGMTFWHNPVMIENLEVGDPEAAVALAQKAALAAGADAVVVAGHMGLRPRGGDDFANRTRSILEQNQGIAAYIAGHTHRDVPLEMIQGVPFTQASYFGIHVGRLDLVFDSDSRKLLEARPITKLMDSSIEMDPAILSLCHEDLERSEEILATPVGEVVETFHAATGPGRPGEMENLIASSIREALQERGVEVDAVFHGLFSSEDLTPGIKTVGDCWKIIPYENFVVTGELDEEVMLRVYNEMIAGSRMNPRNFVGMEIVLKPVGSGLEAIAVLDSEGRRVPRGKKYRIAMNSFDAQSGGQRMMQLREWMENPAAKRTLHPVQTREALIAYFNRNQKLSPIPA